MNEKRSAAHGNAQLSLIPHLDQAGVGARQEDPCPLPGGGGYQDVCSGQKFEKKPATPQKYAPRDPRLGDLRAMGLQRAWIQAAEEIGVDALLTIWRILDADPASSSDGTTLRVPLRAYRTFLRFQRNRYIEALRDLGLNPHQARARLIKQLGERLSISHIRRIYAKR